MISTTLTKDDIFSMNYSDFVALLGQTNTPPGDKNTVNKWISFARISETSRILDLACNTGFSSRHIAEKTGCYAVGFDLSSRAIYAAKQYSSENTTLELNYFLANAEHMPLVSSSFTHIIAGCTFGFFSSKLSVLQNCARVLEPGGYLCESTFFYKDTPPNDLSKQVELILGFLPAAERNLLWWQSFYRKKFDLLWHMVKPLRLYSKDQLKNQAAFLISSSPMLSRLSKPIKSACATRLMSDRMALNSLRQYQGYCIAVWQKPYD